MNETMSIVIPVYNRAKELPRTVSSIAAQQYRPIRLILVDNNSTDNSLEVCKDLQTEFQDESLYIDILQEPKKGASAARNKGLRHVTSRYMMFFDSDDILHPDAVTRYMSAFRQYPETDIIGCTIIFRDEKKFRGQPKAVFSSDLVPQLIHSILSTARFAARTEIIRAVGGWEEDYTGWEDWNLGIRLLLHTSKIHWIKNPPLATIFLHENTITARKDIAGFEQFYHALCATRKDIAQSEHPQKIRYDRFILYRQILLAGDILRAAKRQHDPALHQYSRKLYNEVLNAPQTTCGLRIFFTACYHYAAIGGRGAGLIAEQIIR